MGPRRLCSAVSVPRRAAAAWDADPLDDPDHPFRREWAQLAREGAAAAGGQTRLLRKERMLDDSKSPVTRRPRDVLLCVVGGSAVPFSARALLCALPFADLARSPPPPSPRAQCALRFINCPLPPLPLEPPRAVFAVAPHPYWTPDSPAAATGTAAGGQGATWRDLDQT